MSLPDSPREGRDWCPTCESDADPLAEILVTVYCWRHPGPDAVGTHDAFVNATYLSGSAEAGGEENRRWCDAIHRPER